MTSLISIWRKHAPDEKFGEFIAKCIDVDATDVESSVASGHWYELCDSCHAGLLAGARERFGIK